MEPLMLALLAPPLIVAWLFWTEFKGAGWQPVPKKAIVNALKLAKVTQSDVVYDLGAGDGRVLVAAARAGARAIGIEIDPIRYLICRLRLLRTKNARIVLSDLFKHPLDDASVVFVYLRDWSTERLTKKFSGLKSGTRIVTYHWKINGWRTIAEDKEMGIYVYEV